ncbi:uncharacterized protein LOC126552839 [Aphis gossypii]|uniref:uncharacterized protein LOC126552839 n=1 Tax=Aphis gossypii TaxID=80765 RepID=UPI0021596597|nr:uncharacterized protein LOC126552839 [Aphis gossypii]
MGETPYEHTQPESSIECSQSLTATAHEQQISRICNRKASHSYRSVFNYDPNIDCAKQRAVTIGSKSKICSVLIKKYLQLYHDRVHVLFLGAPTKRPLLVSHGTGTVKKMKCRAFALSVTRLLYLIRINDKGGTGVFMCD